MFEKLFHLSENKTSVKTELIAGLTTFMTMAYIIALNPNLLTGFGAEGQDLWNGVFLATCIASAIGMFAMAFLANKPFARYGPEQLLCCGRGQHCRHDRHDLCGLLPGCSGDHSDRRHYLHLPVRSECPGKDCGGHSSGRPSGHFPCHRPDADEHRPGLQCGHLRRGQRLHHAFLCHA